jgi:iron complex transport system substrate-binding protein
MRIVSLLPSTTEIAASLGFESSLVGRSHECDYPVNVLQLPVLTKAKYPDKGSSSEIDQRVKSLIENGLSVYEVNAEILAELKPDIILTQDHCEVCAVSLNDVELAVKDWTQKNSVEIISVSPTDLDGIFDSFITIGNALNSHQKAQSLIGEMKERLEIIKNTVLNEERKTVATIEWIDPMMTAGNWIPELVEIAGGYHLFAEPGKHSPWINWSTIKDADPDLISIMPCGYNFDQTLKEIDILTSKPGWKDLKAVQNGNVFILDGNQYFNRPGPRIFESTRILAEILHPSLFKPTLENKGWKKFQNDYTYSNQEQ